MDKAQFEREKQCGAAFAIASRLLKSELITQEEYRMLTEVILKTYRPAVSPGSPISPTKTGR